MADVELRRRADFGGDYLTFVDVFFYDLCCLIGILVYHIISIAPPFFVVVRIVLFYDETAIEFNLFKGK
jgi:hypothetical protein